MNSDTPYEAILAWPAGRPRTPAALRGADKTLRYASFTPRYGVWRVRLQLDKLGATRIVASSNAPLNERESGDPPAAHTADPGACIRFELEGLDFAIACDRRKTVVENFVAIARHLEATISIERYGLVSALDLLATFRTKPSAIAPSAPARTWREVLGDLKTPEQVGAVFRRLSAEHHPDRSTGSHEVMAEVSRARDEALRELEAPPPPDIAEVAVEKVETFRFEDTRHFGAMRAAEHFLEEHGFSYGTNQKGAPRGVMLGAHHIPKWDELNERERGALDGLMSGDMRHGPVTVTIADRVWAQVRPDQTPVLRHAARG